jgi:hypothetical protein
MPPSLHGRLPTWILIRQQQQVCTGSNGGGGGGGGGGAAVVCCKLLPHSWRRGLSVSMILLVAVVIRAGISYRELLVRYAAMASYNNDDDDTDTVYHVDSTTRWIQQTSGTSITNRPAAVQGGVAIQDSLGKDNHGENAAATSTLMTAMSLPLVVADDHPPSAVTIVERSIRHVEPPLLPLSSSSSSSSSSNNNITAAVCFKTLFGEIDLGLVIQWAGT